MKLFAVTALASLVLSLVSHAAQAGDYIDCSINGKVMMNFNLDGSPKDAWAEARVRAVGRIGGETQKESGAGQEIYRNVLTLSDMGATSMVVTNSVDNSRKSFAIKRKKDRIVVAKADQLMEPITKQLVKRQLEYCDIGGFDQRYSVSTSGHYCGIDEKQIWCEARISLTIRGR